MGNLKDELIDNMMEGASSRAKSGSSSSRGQASMPEPFCNQILEHQREIRYKLEELSNSDKQVIERLDKIKDLIINSSISRTNIDLLVFIQELNLCLEDERIDQDFALNTQESIRRVLRKYGYKLVDYIDPYRAFYDTEVVDGFEENETQLVARAIIDDNNNLVVPGMIYIGTKMFE